MIYLITCLFTIFFVYYSKYQFINGRAGNWHLFGLLMRITVFIPFFLGSVRLTEILLAVAINAPLFDIGINLIALKQKWNYVGTTSTLDQTFGKIKWYIYLVALLVAVYLLSHLP